MKTKKIELGMEATPLTRSEMRSVLGGNELPPPPGCGKSGSQCLSIFDCCVQVCYFTGGLYGNCGPN